jgi:hypothetical protein
VEQVLAECPAAESRLQALTARRLLAARSHCVRLARAAVLDVSAEDVEMIALQIVFSTACWFGFKCMAPRRERHDHREAALTACDTPSLLSPDVRGESRAHRGYLRAKYIS